MPSSHTNIQRGYADISSGQIHYRLIETNSDRRPVLLLHPSPLSSIVWDGFMTALSRDRTVVAPDTPGFGESSPPASEPEIADYATAMADLLSVLKLGSIDVMGYHTGSLTAVELARLKPDLVHSIVMISATIFTDEERDGFRAQYTPKTLDQKGEALAETWSFMKTFLARRTGTGPAVGHLFRRSAPSHLFPLGTSSRVQLRSQCRSEPIAKTNFYFESGR